MISYWKTQWFNILAGTIAFGIFVFNLIRGEGVSACLWISSAYTWFLLSGISYLMDRVVLLEKEKERNDAMYELVQELLKANQIDRELDKAQDEKIKKLEEKIR